MKFNPKIETNGCDPRMPLIYAWHVGDSLYVGRAMHGERRALKEYSRNMIDMRGNKDYHNGGNFRAVHYAMYDAWIDGRTVRLQYLENCDADELGAREGYWVHKLKPDLNDVKPRATHRRITVGKRTVLTGAHNCGDLQILVDYIDKHGPQTEDVLITLIQHRSGCKAHRDYPQSKHNRGFIGYCLKERNGWLRYVDTDGGASPVEGTRATKAEQPAPDQMMTFKVTDCFDICGHVPKRYIKKLIKAIEAVPQSIDIRDLDRSIVQNLDRKTLTNYSPFDGCRFKCDIAIPKWKTLVEIEKGKLPRLELDILKFQAACLQSDWKYGVLVVPSSHIQLPLAGRCTPVEYLKRLKRMIEPLDMNLAVIGYADPRAEH